MRSAANGRSATSDTNQRLFYIPEINKKFANSWAGSALLKESTLHQVSPYIGKMKSSMASTLISAFTQIEDTIYDPFCGSGSIALEAWTAGRAVIANDLSPYAGTLTRAKLFPVTSIVDAYAEIDSAANQVQKIVAAIDLRKIPTWVRKFFHQETLRETVAWSEVLKNRKSYFLLSCLLGILHHQRPGFLSYPSSHTVPYLREKNYPRHLYPHLYEYRSVRSRLEKKVGRALKRVPVLDPQVTRSCYMRNAADFIPDARVDAIITSPPYMRQLDYGRDNRLRLWFLGESNWKSLDSNISPHEVKFLTVFKRCLKLWHKVLTPSGVCVLVLGDVHSRYYGRPLPDVITHMATEEVGGYSLIWKHTEEIPKTRRVRRDCSGSQSETFLVLRRC
ncbi:MAG: DNA adenine methylase [Acidobacteria bacterium]|nr:DNA adenine methylase [Acidobacteriota bacterium]